MQIFTTKTKKERYGRWIQWMKKEKGNMEKEFAMQKILFTHIQICSIMGGMKGLREYFNGLNRAEKDEFLSKVDGLTENYLRRALGGGVTFSPARCVQVEKASGGKVTRKQLRPHDWKDIWG